MADIDLKWGNLKGWSGFTKEHPGFPIAEQFLETVGASAMEWLDDGQKMLLCELIDTIDGTITNDWTGKTMSKDEAKTYVREYSS